MGYHIELLGGLRVHIGGQTITRFRSQKTALLLAYLSCHAGLPCGREALIERFWPDQAFDDGRNSLRVALASLRKLLEPPPTPAGSVLIASRSHVHLNAEAIRTDIAEFERAIRNGDGAAAGALYVGPFLPGFYDNWAIAEQERLQTLRDRLGDITPATPPPPSVPPPTELPGWLPVMLTRFFGREIELANLLNRLASPTTRLVTITGPGGTGKTRLAIEVGRTLREGKAPARFSGGVWFVPLATLNDPAQIVPSLATVLGLSERPERSLLASLRATLGRQRCLLLLDNLEQFPVESLMDALLELLTALPGATLLCTSRRRTGIAGESVVPLAPLPLPEEEPLAELMNSPAVALFTARAREADVDFALTPRNAEAVRSLCRRLEGVPLALELAASWMSVATPRTLNDELENRLAALSGRDWGKEPRHRSLQAALAWSLDRLPSEVSQVFLGLCVFPGAFTVESAGIVAGATPSILATLIDHSLVQPLPAGDPRRFQLLETLRAGGRERLTPEEFLALQQRHADHVMSCAESGSLDSSLLDDGHAALRFYETHDPEAALRLACLLTELWWPSGQWRIGLTFWERLLRSFDSAALPDKLRALSWQRRGKLAFYATDYTLAERCFEQAQALWQRLGEEARAASMAANLACIAHKQGRSEEAQQALQAALPLLTGSEYERTALSNLVEVQLTLGSLTDAVCTLERTAAQYTSGHPWIADLRARLAFACGELSEAQTQANYALTYYRENGEVMRTAEVLLLLSQIALGQNDTETATTALTESITLRQTFSDDLGPETRDVLLALQERGVALHRDNA